jgi:acyl-CoA synthetase (AMP-forming)/AMP-acid ligase II
MAICSSENIDCSEVEAALLERPSVREACVFAVSDERFGEEVGATIC